MTPNRKLLEVSVEFAGLLEQEACRYDGVAAKVADATPSELGARLSKGLRDTAHLYRSLGDVVRRAVSRER